MKYCDDHSGCLVVYEFQHCPLCKEEENVKDLQDEYEKLEKENNEFEEEISRLNEELSEYGGE